MRFLTALALPTIALITTALLAGPAAAQNAPPPAPPMMAPAPPPPAQEEKPGRLASITFSPIHLIFPIVEISAEFAITPKIGVAGFAGFGTVPLTRKLANGTTETVERLKAWEVGARFNYYVIGTFDHGMQLGAEVQYLKVARSEANSTQIAASAAGFGIGPYVGYKLITSVGFTFEGNLGVQYIAARGQATDGTNSATASEKRVIPLLNLNVGWSF